MLRIYTYIIYAVIAIGLCACGGKKSDPEPTPNPTPGDDQTSIAFGTSAAMPEAGSRAALSDYLDTFTLWGAKTTGGDDATGYTGHQDVMIGYKLQYLPAGVGVTDTNTSGWEYLDVKPGQTAKYWDFKATSYRFFAVAPHSDAYTSTKRTIGDTTYREIKVTADASDPNTIYISELWFCNQSYLYGLPVNLTFKQPFAFVQFSFIDKEGKPMPVGDEGVVYVDGTHDRRITEIKFHPASNVEKIAIAGSITIGVPLEGKSRDLRFECPYAGITGSVEQLEQPGATYRVLPTGQQGDFEIELVYDDDISDARDGAWMVAPVPSEFLDWQPNMVYTYVFKITGNIVEFIRVVQVASTQWLEEHGTHTIYNW